MSDALTRDRATLRMELQSVAEQAECLASRCWPDSLASEAKVEEVAKLIASLATIVAALEGGE